jgi:RNA recognition motif-containing protein
MVKKKIYVGNIPFSATEQDIRDLFSEYGEIVLIKIKKSKSLVLLRWGQRMTQKRLFQD